MTIKKAHEIIADYGKLLAHATPDRIFMAKPLLPCSVARIKFAIFRYILELVRTEKLNKQIAETLIVAYSHLGFFVDENKVEILNRITSKKDNLPADLLEKATEMKELIRLVNIQKELLSKEIQEFINEALRMNEDSK